MVSLVENFDATLGVLVTSSKYVDYVINLAAAASERKKKMHLFFMGDSVAFCYDSRFESVKKNAQTAEVVDMTY